MQFSTSKCIWGFRTKLVFRDLKDVTSLHACYTLTKRTLAVMWRMDGGTREVVQEDHLEDIILVQVRVHLETQPLVVAFG